MVLRVLNRAPYYSMLNNNKRRIAIFLFRSNICSEGGAALSRDWTQEELKNASKAMKAAGHLGYEEFCEQLDKTIFTAYCKDADKNLIKISGPYNCKEELEKQL